MVPHGRGLARPLRPLAHVVEPRHANSFLHAGVPELTQHSGKTSPRLDDKLTTPFELQFQKMLNAVLSGDSVWCCHSLNCSKLSASREKSKISSNCTRLFEFPEFVGYYYACKISDQSNLFLKSYSCSMFVIGLKVIFFTASRISRSQIYRMPPTFDTVCSIYVLRSMQKIKEIYAEVRAQQLKRYDPYATTELVRP